MNEKLTEKLREKHPMLRPDKQPVKDGFLWDLRAIGIDCNDGWYQLIDDLCTELEQNGFGDIVVSQVKEKLGGLRFYYLGEHDPTTTCWKIVHKYEQKSLTTCEMCGNSDAYESHLKNGWIRTLCHECDIKENG